MRTIAPSPPEAPTAPIDGVDAWTQAQRNRAGTRRLANRIAVFRRMMLEDLRRWPFDLAVNVVLASPLVPRLVRIALMRALGMEVRNLDIYPRCHFRSTKLKVGKGTVINSHCHINNDDWIEIGDFAGLAMNVTLITAGHKPGPRECRAGALQLAPIVIGHGAWIGANVVVLPGVTIGDGCVIAAGSVVRSDCEPDGFYGGIPAKPIKRMQGGARKQVAAPEGAPS